jgi:hypothetical protein
MTTTAHVYAKTEIRFMAIPLCAACPENPFQEVSDLAGYVAHDSFLEWVLKVIIHK